MSFWPFAVSLLLVVVLVVMWFSATSERDQWKADAEKARSAQKKAEEDLQGKIKEFQEVSRQTGYLGGGSTSSAAEIAAAIKEYGTKLGDIMTVEFGTDRYQEDPSGGGGKTEKTAGGGVKVRYLTDAEIADAPTLQGFFSKFEIAANRMKNDIARAYEDAKKARDERDAATKANTETVSAKDKRIKDLTDEKSNIDNAAHEKEAELNEKIAQKEQALTKATGETEAIRKQSSENEAKLIAQNNEAQGTIRTLVQRDAPVLTEGPDGEVIVSDNGVAIVNRGKAQFLMPGTIFEVLGRAKGGATYKKGTIKVTSCDDESARAVILEESVKDPITKGDLIQSLTYSPNRKIHFVLVGDFKKMGKSQAEALLKRLGAVVDSKVTAETNYVVVGAAPAGTESMDDNEAVKAAKDLGIRMITEDGLASFVRY
jgi:hypothetical protein